MDILKILVSITENFAARNLFNGSNDHDAQYILKGMICFQGAHYLAFFRRLLTKMEHLNTSKASMALYQKEVNESEWTEFNDTMIQPKGSW